jgi:hypothetical protein
MLDSELYICQPYTLAEFAEFTKKSTATLQTAISARSKSSSSHTSTMPVSATSSARALGAILPLITAGQPYEAHQKARTFASRYSKSSQYDTAIDVLFQSARELFKTGQQGSGVDLSGFLLDVYESKGEVVSDESRGWCSFCGASLRWSG